MCGPQLRRTERRRRRVLLERGATGAVVAKGAGGGGGAGSGGCKVPAAGPGAGSGARRTGRGDAAPKGMVVRHRCAGALLQRARSAESGGGIRSARGGGHRICGGWRTREGRGPHFGEWQPGRRRWGRKQITTVFRAVREEAAQNRVAFPVGPMERRACSGSWSTSYGRAASDSAMVVAGPASHAPDPAGCACGGPGAHARLVL